MSSKTKKNRYSSNIIQFKSDLKRHSKKFGYAITPRAPKES